MKSVSDQQNDAISKFGRSWSFWTAFAWVETRDTTIGVRIEIAKMGKPIGGVPTMNRERAITGVHHRLCLSDDGESLHLSSDCPRWRDTWQKLQVAASEGKIKTLGIKRDDDVPTEISSTTWQFARIPSDPTTLRIETTEWSRIKFDANHIMKLFKPRTVDRRKQIPPAMLRNWLIGILPEKPRTTHLVSLASIEFPDNLPPSKGTMAALCKELDYSLPSGRPRKT